ncbi:diguanylate cyclase [Alteromonas sp. BL110]|uniref:diguanylate cyclase n=1 Tax=Alteromonas sp. BL110 TaxID=1714845 RepID=UPI000E546C56|nr:diguanylate cyclase [Alteromonas sp. BL110]AXT37755.1 diguanylate cyclase [Alteromonas sp. BL110]RKM80494.1 diguanylate cyclase [Alteromonas sp. BL110]
MEAKQLQALKQNNALLCQFIVKLSAFYEGFSDKIDTELKVLRGHLSGTPNFSLAAVSIEKLNKSLQHQEITLRKYSIDTVSSLEDAMKQLQKIVFEDSELKGLTTQELIKLNQPVGDIFSIYKLYAKAIALHRIALNKEMIGLEQPETVEARPEKKESATAGSIKDENPHYRSILVELNHLITSYAQKKPSDQQLNDIKQRLDEGMDNEQLLKSCVVILRMIVQDAMSEASLTGKVIQSLHRSLGEISNDVNTTIENSQVQFEQRKAGTEQIKRHISYIEETVSESDSLESLKEQTQLRVEKLVATLSEQQDSDEQGQEALLALLSTMQSRIDTLQQQTSVYKKKLAEQAMQSRTDPLTRLPNRQAYNEKLDAAFANYKENGTTLAVAVVDIDHFKSINDRFGHAAGDKTLQVVSKFLKQNLSENDFVARWGGEEFVMLLPESQMTEIDEKLNEIRTKLAAMPFKFKQEKVKITASFGASCFGNEDTTETVFERADEYLYKAKRNGRNLVVTDLSTDL